MSTDRGSVRYHRNGWELSVQVDGRRVFRRHPGPDTRAGRRAAERALEQLVEGRHATALTVADLLARYQAAESHRWAPSTRAKTPGHIAVLDERFGPVAVDELRLATIEQTWGAMVAAGLSPGTVRRYHAVLSAALTHAVRWQMIASNPAHGVRLPKAARVKLDHLPALNTAMDSVDRLTSHRLRAAGRVALGTGARRGELAALRWCDVDMEAGTVRIAEAISDRERAGTKAGPGRTISIDPATVAALKGWRPEAKRHALALGHRVGARDPIWCDDTAPTVSWHPGAISRAWGHARGRIGLPAVRWHDLRHIHATALLRAGVPVHVVAHRLGHASAKMTLDVYAHVMPADDRLAADVIGRAQAT